MEFGEFLFYALRAEVEPEAMYRSATKKEFGLGRLG